MDRARLAAADRAGIAGRATLIRMRPWRRAGSKALGATVVVELGVRFGHCTRALLKGAEAVDGQVWGVDALERHDVRDERFTFIQADPLKVAGRWERIDLLHVDIDPQREDDARKWLGRICRAVPGHRRLQ